VLNHIWKYPLGRYSNVCISVQALKGMSWVFTHMNKHVFPQAPSPTMTSFRRKNEPFGSLSKFSIGGFEAGVALDELSPERTVEGECVFEGRSGDKGFSRILITL